MLRQQKKCSTDVDLSPMLLFPGVGWPFQIIRAQMSVGGPFAVIQEETRWTMASGPEFGVCNSPSTTRTQLIAVFVAYVDKNPQIRNHNFVEVAFDALREAFPCKAAGQSRLRSLSPHVRFEAQQGWQASANASDAVPADRHESLRRTAGTALARMQWSGQ